MCISSVNVTGSTTTMSTYQNYFNQISTLLVHFIGNIHWILINSIIYQLVNKVAHVIQRLKRVSYTKHHNMPGAAINKI